jgi:hypothetical protein
MQAGSTAAVSAAIGSVKGQLLKSVLGMNMFLVRGQGRGAAPATLMRTYIPPELMPCLEYELLAASGQYIEFDTTLSSCKRQNSCMASWAEC